MSRYLINTGEELVFALKAGSTCQPEQFVDYSANIDFWFEEFCQFKKSISEYEARVEHAGRMRESLYPGSAASGRDATSAREREIVFREARDNFLKIIKRGLELEMIPAESYQYMLEKID